MKATIIILALILMAPASCSKNDDGPKLPPVTQTGENTFGCYVDGKLLVPRSGTGTFNSPDYGLITESGPGPGDNIQYHEIKARDFRSGNGGLLTIHMVGLLETGEGTYTLNASNCYGNIYSPQNMNLFCRWWDEESQAYKWYCSIENGGILTILKFDNESGIISGTFSCTVVNRDDPSDFIEITEGRFDINGYTVRDKWFP